MEDLQLYLAIVAQVLAGVTLAAAAGLRAFIPPLLVGLLGRLDVVTLRPGLDWMESTPALVIFGTAVVLEILGDKIPWLDHALDTVQTFLKPASGILVAAAGLVDLPPLWAAILAIVVGGTVAGAVHVSKAGVRLASTGTTGGLANPALSAAEDGLSAAGTLLSVFFPILAFALLVGGVALVVRGIRRRRRSRAPARP
ncbi:MAG: DUF4126 domain-containing protein [Acidobacteriota bacterium]|jgi:hypothetical protein